MKTTTILRQVGSASNRCHAGHLQTIWRRFETFLAFLVGHVLAGKRVRIRPCNNIRHFLPQADHARMRAVHRTKKRDGSPVPCILNRTTLKTCQAANMQYI